MKLNKTVNIPDVSMFSAQADIQHHTSFSESLSLPGQGLNFLTAIFPPCSDHPLPQIILSVFVHGKQHVVFSGSPEEAHEFFSRFPRN